MRTLMSPCMRGGPGGAETTRRSPKPEAVENMGASVLTLRQLISFHLNTLRRTSATQIISFCTRLQGQTSCLLEFNWTSQLSTLTKYFGAYIWLSIFGYTVCCLYMIRPRICSDQLRRGRQLEVPCWLHYFYSGGNFGWFTYMFNFLKYKIQILLQSLLLLMP